MIIGLTGKAGSGKDTVADILVKNHGAVKVAFADTLKRTAQQIWGFTEEQLWGPSSKRNEPDSRYPREHSWILAQCACCGAGSSTGPKCFLTPRYALQLLGTEYGRHCYQDVWVEKTFERMARLGAEISARNGKQLNTVRFVISDVRFPNEVRAIHNAGGCVWKTTYGTGLAGGGGAHESESHIDKLEVDFVIPSGTLESLPVLVREYFEYAKGPSDDTYRGA